MHTQDPTPEPSEVRDLPLSNMIYLFGQRQPDNGLMLWYGNCSVCRSCMTFPTPKEALAMVTDHVMVHYEGVI